MLIHKRPAHDPIASEITPRRVYERRRDLLKAAGAGFALEAVRVIEGLRSKRLFIRSGHSA